MTHRSPSAPRPTMAATARASPAMKFRFDAVGGGPPHGNATRKPFATDPTTVRLTIAVVAPSGRYVPASGIDRTSKPGNRAPPGSSRVSNARAGVTGAYRLGPSDHQPPRPTTTSASNL